MDKEKWKAEVINSIEGIRKAEPEPYLYEKVWAAVEKEKKSIPLYTLSLIAASLLLLIALNTYVLSSDIIGNEVPGTAYAEDAYAPLLTNYNIYD